MLCWLLKDLGWVLLCAPVAFSAAVIALVLQAHDVLQQLDNAPMGEWVHSLAALGWLCGSSIWMTAQLLFEPEVHKSRASPWYSGSIFTGSADRYHSGVFAMQAINITVILCLSAFYAARLRESGISFDWRRTAANPTGDAIRERKASLISDGLGAAALDSSGTQVLVFGMMTTEVYSKIFIVPLILKDLFWCHQSFIPSILCVLLVIVLMADYVMLFKKWKNLPLLLWVCGTAVWVCNDLVMHEQEMWPLLLTILVFAVASCIMSAVIVARPPLYDDQREIGSKEEYSSLL